MNSSQSMYNLSSISSPQYIPSHLRQTQRVPQTPRSSPPRLRRSSTTGRFGGPSFGTPKPSRSSRSVEASIEDAPPTESIYDYNGGASFASPQSTVQGVDISAVAIDSAPSTPFQQKKQTATLSSLPCAVIIFGFPAQMTTKVLDSFAKFGQIEEHSSSSTAQNLSMGSNWMKITYRNSTSAQRAVAANGTLLAGHMIGCVFAQEEPLASIDSNTNGNSHNDSHHEDAMEIDSQTPPRPKAVNQIRNQAYSTPIRQNQNGIGNVLPSTPSGGRRIEILSSEAIYKSTSPLSERAAAWVPSWLSASDDSTTPPSSAGTAATQATAADAGWPRRMLRGLVDTIFGF